MRQSSIADEDIRESSEGSEAALYSFALASELTRHGIAAGVAVRMHQGMPHAL